jgi:type III secretion HrpO family protein
MTHHTPVDGLIPISALVAYAQEALLLTVALSLPVVGVAAVVGLFVAALQAASQVQDATLAHLPRLLGVVGALVVLGPWIGGQVARFAERLLLLAH